MLVDNGKMSKSLGNVYRIDQLEERGYCALDYRYFCLNAHYRKKLNFTFEGMDGAKTSYARLLNTLYAHKISSNSTDPQLLAQYKKQFDEAINDDLNIPLALGVVWTMVKELKSKDIYALAIEFDKVLGLSLDKAQPTEEEQADIPEEIQKLAEERFEAKKRKDFATADALRAKIAQLGYSVLDSKEGFKLIPTSK